MNLPPVPNYTMPQLRGWQRVIEEVERLGSGWQNVIKGAERLGSGWQNVIKGAERLGWIVAHGPSYTTPLVPGRAGFAKTLHIFMVPSRSLTEP
jgi:hypothetical protein